MEKSRLLCFAMVGGKVICLVLHTSKLRFVGAVHFVSALIHPFAHRILLRIFAKAEPWQKGLCPGGEALSKQREWLCLSNAGGSASAKRTLSVR
jgi:hypothetical protein